jgi:hypothetical protein
MKPMAGAAVAALVVLAGGVPAQGGDFGAQREAARAALAKALEGYAEWCQSKSLFHSRKTALETLLELVPDHPEARKALGHVRAKDGSWKAPDKPKTFRDFDKKALEEAPARWREATSGYVARMVSLLEGNALAPEERELAAHEALWLDPENERVHLLLGEVRGDKGWVLPETLRAKERRAALRELVQSALEGAPAASPAPLAERERKIPLHLEALAAPGLRVVGTADAEELLLAAQAALALERLLQAVFESRHSLPADTTVFLLSDPGHLQAFLEHHPSIAPEQHAYFQALEGSGIQGTSDFAFWSGDTQRRIDGVVRLLLGYWLSGAFEINADHGWAYEGFGLFLTRSLVRTRMTWLAQPSRVLAPEADVALRQKLIDPATNWMDEALRMLREGRQPPLGELLPKGASQLSTEDVLYAYAIATYLLEARAEVVPRMLSRIGAGYPRSQAFQEALGMDLAAFERHLLRWLGERT